MLIKPYMLNVLTKIRTFHQPFTGKFSKLQILLIERVLRLIERDYTHWKGLVVLTCVYCQFLQELGHSLYWVVHLYITRRIWSAFWGFLWKMMVHTGRVIPTTCISNLFCFRHLLDASSVSACSSQKNMPSLFSASDCCWMFNSEVSLDDLWLYHLRERLWVIHYSIY